MAFEVSGLDPEGKKQQWEVSGWPARIVQHEVDHMKVGKPFVLARFIEEALSTI